MRSRLETVGGLSQRTARSRTYRDGSRKGILAMGSHNSDENVWFVEDVIQGEIRAITEGPQIPMGMAATDVDWGNSAARTRMSTLKTNCQTALFASGKVHLMGVSSGGLTVLNWAKYNPTLVQSICVVVPVVDVQDVYTNNRGGYAASVSTAYGGAPPDAENPADNPSAFTGIPMRIYYSTSDPIATPTPIETFAAATGAELVSMGAIGHTYAAPWSGQAAGAFFAAHD